MLSLIAARKADTPGGDARMRPGSSGIIGVRASSA
jgi:hypothetical protein